MGVIVTSGLNRVDDYRVVLTCQKRPAPWTASFASLNRKRRPLCDSFGGQTVRLERAMIQLSKRAPIRSTWSKPGARPWRVRRTVPMVKRLMVAARRYHPCSDGAMQDCRRFEIWARMLVDDRDKQMMVRLLDLSTDIYRGQRSDSDSSADDSGLKFRLSLGQSGAVSSDCAGLKRQIAASARYEVHRNLRQKDPGVTMPTVAASPSRSAGTART